MKDAATVLVVDDEPAICWAMERLLREDGHVVVTASSAEEGLSLAAETQPSLVLLDVRLPKQDGLSALPEFVRITGGAPVVVMTAFGDLETAVAAVRCGASDYLTKPFPLEDALRVCRTALRAAPGERQSVARLQRDDQPPRLVGRSAAMQQAFRQIALVATSDLSVLITGETGTGKELVAAAIHRHSHRAMQPYLAVAPVALHPDLIESELFGHVRGAFTGAAQDREGLFERCEGGTVMLDEIGELPLAIQVKLLRVLEQGEYTRVGETEPRRCNVRVLAATHRDLANAVGEGSFREDLFFRLNGLHIHLPPLRQRPEDIAPLCEYFLGRLGYEGSAVQLPHDVLEALQSRPWYGNVRELRNAIEHAAVVSRGRTLVLSDFPDPQPGRVVEPTTPDYEAALREAVAAWTAERLTRSDEVTQSDETNVSQSNGGELYADLLAKIEPPLLRSVLAATGGNRVRAAERLGMHRGTLREKLRQHGLEDK